jgi:type I restriction enzyme S subunit
VGHWKRLAGSSRKDPNITKSEVAAFPLLLPPVNEQKAIVCILSTWDRAIRQLTNLIAAKLRFKQVLMQQLLTGSSRLTIKGSINEQDNACTGNRRVDDTIVELEIEFKLTGNSFQEGIPRDAECPNGWQLHTLGDVLKIVERPAKIIDKQKYQLVTAKRYRGGIVPREQLCGDQIKTKKQFFIATGDFLISKRQIIHGACGLVPSSLDGAVVSNEYSCLQTTKHLDPNFLNYLVHTRHIQQTFFHSSVGVTLEKMIFRIDQWLKHQVNLPSINEQRAIARLLATIDREILLLAKERRLLKQQKKGLMQKLLTGEVRVNL